MECPPIQVTNCNFRYSPDTPIVLKDLNFQIEKGSRVLVLGANGAGKSTLFRLLAGKHMHPRKEVLVLGRSAFYETPKQMAYLGSDWRHSISCVSNNVPYHGDFSVQEMLNVLARTAKPERIQELVDLLDINVNWRMHQISDGETRRVQILLALMNPFEVLLLDEITVDLDVLTRINLLEFFRKEADLGCTIMYATHIFDGIDSWPTHFIRIENNRATLISATEVTGPIYQNAARWLQEEREDKKKRLAETQK
jgi:CCR4-NOT complex subunit CAF16